VPKSKEAKRLLAARFAGIDFDRAKPASEGAEHPSGTAG